jgi:hypothetical protein
LSRRLYATGCFEIEVSGACNVALTRVITTDDDNSDM